MGWDGQANNATAKISKTNIYDGIALDLNIVCFTLNVESLPILMEVPVDDDPAALFWFTRNRHP